MHILPLLIFHLITTTLSVHHEHYYRYDNVKQQNNAQQIYKKLSLTNAKEHHDTSYYKTSAVAGISASASASAIYLPEPIIDLSIDTQSPLSENDVLLQCPNGCVCQYAHFMDLPISRWINRLQALRTNERIHKQQNHNDNDEDLINNNEALFDGDETFLTNPYMKQATCILQDHIDPVKLVNSLPHDLQALTLLYISIGKNKTVHTSTLKTLNQLTTLEIRGSQDCSFTLIFDEPMSFIQYANFESITLISSEKQKYPEYSIHPSESYSYRPKSEILDQPTIKSKDNPKMKINFNKEPAESMNYIVPYHIYVEEVKKARMPSFYGWERLEVLQIHSCGFNNLYWEIFEGLKNLQHLSLEYNNIEYIPPFALYGLMHIKTLSLASNYINDLNYLSLAGLLELEILDLSNNKLEMLSETSFPPFPKLERIDFSNNPIRSIFPATFLIMNGTRFMKFSSNETPLKLRANLPFESLTQLRELILENVAIGALEQKVFKDLHSLEKLKIRGQIRKIEFDAFANLEKLRELDLAKCGIGEISMDALMGCYNLEILKLSNNNLTNIPNGLLDDQKQLQEIYLDNNQLKTLPKNFFQQTKLQLARLNENPWICSCDMKYWKSKITNQKRTNAIERCLTDYMTGKRYACRQIINYEFDRSLAPRCENFNRRGVFYILHKQLKCGPSYIVKRKLIKSTKTNALIQQKNSILDDMKPDEQQAWHMRRIQKMRHAIAQKNTLYYQLQQQKQMQHHITADDNNEIDNDI